MPSKKRVKLSEKTKNIESDNESITSESSIENEKVQDYEEAYENETPMEKKVRLTKKAIEKAKQALGPKQGNSDLVIDLRQEALLDKGLIILPVADKLVNPNPDSYKYLSASSKSVLSLTISNNSNDLYFGTKDAILVKWNISKNEKTIKIIGGSKKKPNQYHNGPIISLSIAHDDKYLASGSADTSIIIWNPEKLVVFMKLDRHKAPVTALDFQKTSHMLFSGDRKGRVCVWVMPLKEMIQDQGARTNIEVLAIAGLKKERCVSCTGYGGVNLSMWKINEESVVQYMVKKNYEESLECVCAPTDDIFITGSVMNKIYVWHIGKGSPVFTIHNAHSAVEFGSDEHTLWKKNNPNTKLINDPCIVTSLATLQGTDLVASGSSRGEIHFWHLRIPKGHKIVNRKRMGSDGEEEDKSDEDNLEEELLTCADKINLVKITTIQVNGYINSLKFTNDGKYLAAALGQEYRIGSLYPRKAGIKSSVILVPVNMPLGKTNYF